MKNINDYNAEDLAQDSSFISWVKGLQYTSASQTNWERWIDQNPEKQVLVDDAIALVKAIQFKEPNVSKEREDLVWGTINKKIEQQDELVEEAVERRSIIKTITYVSLGLAAAIGLYVFAYVPSDLNKVNLNTSFAEVKSHTLPDGSQVTINAESELIYNTKTWSSNRVLHVSGEAFFEVVKGSTFTVNTSNGNVVVLGTSFNVFSRKKQLNVYCETGKVSVQSNDNVTVLIPGDAVSVSNNVHTDVSKISGQGNRSVWKQGIYNYDSVPLVEVINELQRQMNVEIEISKKVSGISFTGSFTTGSLDSALSEVLWPLNLKYKKVGTKIIVTQ